MVQFSNLDKYGDQLTEFEVKDVIDNLKESTLSSVGSDEWHRQRELVQKLNILAHSNVVNNEHEYVTEYLLSFDKFSLLIHELLVIETWKAKIGTLLEPEILENHHKNSRIYFLYYYEAELTNLIELVAFNIDTLKLDSTQDLLIDLVDYCYRKMNQILSQKKEPHKILTKEELLKQDDEDSWKMQVSRIEFNCQMSALAIFRYITDLGSDMPPSLVGRILDTHDFVLTLVYIIEYQPWKKESKKGPYIFQDRQWKNVSYQDSLAIQQHEAQAWLAINNLLVDSETSRKYEYTQHRKNTVLRLSKYLNNMLIDQLPVLVDIQRVVSQLQITTPPANPQSKMLYIEQISQLRTSLMKEDFEQIAQEQSKTLFSVDKETLMRDAQRISRMYGNLDELLKSQSEAEDQVPSS